MLYYISTRPEPADAHMLSGPHGQTGIVLKSANKERCADTFLVAKVVIEAPHTGSGSLTDHFDGGLLITLPGKTAQGRPTLFGQTGNGTAAHGRGIGRGAMPDICCPGIGRGSALRRGTGHDRDTRTGFARVQAGQSSSLRMSPSSSPSRV